jgi:hypothetical protein
VSELSSSEKEECTCRCTKPTALLMLIVHLLSHLPISRPHLARHELAAQARVQPSHNENPCLGANCVFANSCFGGIRVSAEFASQLSAETKIIMVAKNSTTAQPSQISSANRLAISVAPFVRPLF